jgi:TPR repeat protein
MKLRLHTIALSVVLALISGGAWPGTAGAQDSPSTAQSDALAEAAARGNAAAQYEYGHLYETGAEGITTDYEVAADWYRLAAEQDHLAAILALSTLLLQRDPPESIRLVLRAAELGSPEAQWRAGQVYSGRIFVPLVGVNLDREIALQWFERAVQQGHHLAQEALADLYTDSDDPSLYQEAFTLYQQAADGGAAWAALRLGIMYTIGEGVEENEAAAFGWFARLGSEYELNPDRFSAADLDVLGGLQSYYGLNFLGGDIERDLSAAREAFTIATQSMNAQLFQPFLHASFGRTAERILEKLETASAP